MRIPVKQCRAAPALPLPAYAHDGDACVDLMASLKLPILISPHGRVTIPTGIAVSVPEGHALLVVPRSGLAAQHGVTVLNAPGIVDATYRGEVQVILHNTDPQHWFTVEPGMRVAQAMVLPLPRVTWQLVDSLDETTRGAGGLGSTGL